MFTILICTYDDDDDDDDGDSNSITSTTISIYLQAYGLCYA